MLKRAVLMLWIVLVAVVPFRFNNDALAQTAPPAVSTPVMNDELMGRLIEYTRTRKKGSSTDARICKIFNLCDGTTDMSLQLAKISAPDGSHFFALPVDADSTDILIFVKHDTILECYLTDKTAKLRAAAISENGVAHLITNEKAAEKFNAELALFAKNAAEHLPPTGTHAQ